MTRDICELFEPALVKYSKEFVISKVVQIILLLVEKNGRDVESHSSHAPKQRREAKEEFCE